MTSSERSRGGLVVGGLGALIGTMAFSVGLPAVCRDAVDRLAVDLVGVLIGRNCLAEDRLSEGSGLGDLIGTVEFSLLSSLLLELESLLSSLLLELKVLRGLLGI